MIFLSNVFTQVSLVSYHNQFWLKFYPTFHSCTPSIYSTGNDWCHEANQEARRTARPRAFDWARVRLKKARATGTNLALAPTQSECGSPTPFTTLGAIFRAILHVVMQPVQRAAFESPTAHRRDRPLVISFVFWGQFRNQSQTYGVTAWKVQMDGSDSRRGQLCRKPLAVSVLPSRPIICPRKRRLLNWFADIWRASLSGSTFSASLKCETRALIFHLPWFCFYTGSSYYLRPAASIWATSTNPFPLTMLLYPHQRRCATAQQRSQKPAFALQTTPSNERECSLVQ